MSYWMDDDSTRGQRAMNTEQPYRFVGRDSQERTLVVTGIWEGEEWNPDTDEVTDNLEVIGYAVPEYTFSRYEVVEVWHTNNPDAILELTFGVTNDGDFSANRMSGKGSMILLGDLQHVEEEQIYDRS